MCEAFVSVVGGSKQGPTSAMDWPIIGGQPVDLARLAEISGREERYVYGLVDRIRSASRIKLPTPSAKLSEELSAIDNLGVIYDSYLCTRNPMIRASIMVRWIQLAQTEIEFRKPSRNLFFVACRSDLSGRVIPESLPLCCWPIWFRPTFFYSARVRFSNRRGRNFFTKIISFLINITSNYDR